VTEGREGGGMRLWVGWALASGWGMVEGGAREEGDWEEVIGAGGQVHQASPLPSHLPLSPSPSDDWGMGGKEGDVG
jgi:hypothetical protein